MMKHGKHQQDACYNKQTAMGTTYLTLVMPQKKYTVLLFLFKVFEQKL